MKKSLCYRCHRRATHVITTTNRNVEGPPTVVARYTCATHARSVTLTARRGGRQARARLLKGKGKAA